MNDDYGMEQILTIETMSARARNEAIQQTVRRERKKLFGFIRSKVASDEDAEDILQDVWYQFVNTMQSDLIDKAVSWLFKVANNRIIDWYRKRRPVTFNRLMAEERASSGEDDIPLQLEDALYDPAENPDELYQRSMLWPLLSEALDEMPPEQKEVFVMNELEDIPFREISEITGITLNTLLSRKRYAVLFLRERLQDLYDEFFNE